MIQNDTWIKEQAQLGMIRPFEPQQVSVDGDGNRILSYGTSSYGYDIRAADEWLVFSNINSKIVDPKNFNTDVFTKVSGNGYVLVPPNSFVLARSLEYIHVPKDVLVLCIGKSSMARCGIVANVTPLEPDWQGHITLEFSNTTTLPVKLYANEGIVQLLFLKGNPCEISYAQRAGKYQYQYDITVPRV